MKKDPKTKTNKNGKTKSIEQLAEDFIESDNAAATAGKFLLAFLAMGGIVFAGALLPGMLSSMSGFGKSKRYSRTQYRNALYNLKKRNLIEVIREKDGKIAVKLTNKGEARIREFSFEDIRIKKPLHWDKKWRILIFDIPTEPKIYNQAREALRAKIKELGFYQMQKSVWVCPYECEDEILLIAEMYQVLKHIEIITAERILHENMVKRHFGL